MADVHLRIGVPCPGNAAFDGVKRPGWGSGSNGRGNGEYAGHRLRQVVLGGKAGEALTSKYDGSVAVTTGTPNWAELILSDPVPHPYYRNPNSGRPDERTPQPTRDLPKVGSRWVHGADDIAAGRIGRPVRVDACVASSAESSPTRAGPRGGSCWESSWSWVGCTACSPKTPDHDPNRTRRCPTLGIPGSGTFVFDKVSEALRSSAEHFGHQCTRRRRDPRRHHDTRR
jgi:hypothetical protein